MFLSTIKRHLTTWIAVFAIFGGTVLPSVAMAMKSNHSNPLVMELCSTADVGQVISIDLDQGQSMSKMEHCPFCLVNVPFVPVTQSNLSFEKPQISQFVPQLFYRSPKPLFSWAKHPSQAPPQSV
jgi:hypothetical protein